MGIHAIFYNEEYDEEFGAHELVDIDYTCSFICMTNILSEYEHAEMAANHVVTLDDTEDPHRTIVTDANGKVLSALEYGARPGGSETDYDVYCANESCKVHLWHGLQCPEECTEVQLTDAQVDGIIKSLE